MTFSCLRNVHIPMYATFLCFNYCNAQWSMKAEVYTDFSYIIVSLVYLLPIIDCNNYTSYINHSILSIANRSNIPMYMNTIFYNFRFPVQYKSMQMHTVPHTT